MTTEYEMEWNVICRVCLQDGEMISVFDKDENNLKLCDKIMSCASVSIKRGENMPELICMQCVEDLATAYRFRRTCESSDTILQSYQIDENSTNEPAGIDVLSLLQQSGEVSQMLPDGVSNGVHVHVANNKTPVSGNVKEEVIKSDDENYHEEYLLIENEEPLGDSIQDPTHSELDKINTNDTFNKIKIIPISELSVKEEAQYIEIEDFLGSGELDLRNENIVYILPDESEVKRGTDMGTCFRRKKGDPKDTRPHVCVICGKSYRYRFNLEAHTRRHTGEKPFMCGVCGKTFVISFELRRHMRCHTGAKPYQCKYCEKKFSDFGSRIKHERTHTGERPYVCKICGKTFAYSHVLSSHNLIHTGEKKYCCIVCGKRFTKAHHLKAHMNVHLRTNPSKARVKTEELIQELIVPPVQGTYD